MEKNQNKETTTLRENHCMTTRTFVYIWYKIFRCLENSRPGEI